MLKKNAAWVLLCVFGFAACDDDDSGRSRDASVVSDGNAADRFDARVISDGNAADTLIASDGKGADTLADAAVGACGSAAGPSQSDPFAGIWTGVQGNEMWTVTSSNGCSYWVGSVGGSTCDVCVGTYTLTGNNGAGAKTANSTVSCTPAGACSISPAHTNVGTLVRTGCAVDYDYDYGGGRSAWSGTRTADATVSACGLADAGTL